MLEYAPGRYGEDQRARCSPSYLLGVWKPWTPWIPQQQGCTWYPRLFEAEHEPRWSIEGASSRSTPPRRTRKLVSHKLDLWGMNVYGRHREGLNIYGLEEGMWYCWISASSNFRHCTIFFDNGAGLIAFDESLSTSLLPSSRAFYAARTSILSSPYIALEQPGSRNRLRLG
jgi:hypothetical protein